MILYVHLDYFSEVLFKSNHLDQTGTDLATHFYIDDYSSAIYNPTVSNTDLELQRYGWTKVSQAVLFSRSITVSPNCRME
jgi:hypothetical protein